MAERKVNLVKLAYAVSIVLPVIVSAVKHLVLFVTDAVNDIVTQYNVAMNTFVDEE